MAATKTTLVALAANRILVTGIDTLTLDAAKAMIGRTIEMPTLMANETADYTISDVSRNRETGDFAAWMTRAEKIGGHHAKLVTQR